MTRSSRNSGFFFWLLPVLVFMGSCAPDQFSSWSNLVTRGEYRGFRPVQFETGLFQLAGMMKGSPGQSEALVVYLEGDGQAIHRGRPSSDPTPLNPQAFELAIQDSAPLVLYLARVGQYQPDQLGKKYQTYWSDQRLGEDVVVAANKALDQAKALLGAATLHLVGYSGGGGLALLLAERRRDVASLTTVAGLLDTVWWVEEGRFKPLTGLNPADQAALLLDVPQVHFYGESDQIIPPELSAHFQSLMPFTRFLRVGLPGDHWSEWTGLWPKLLQSYLLPRRSPYFFRPPAAPAAEENLRSIKPK